MLVAIDIGNTAFDVAILDGMKVVKRYQTSTIVSPARLQTQLKKIVVQLEPKAETIEAVLVCSVVPDAVKILVPLLRPAFAGKVFILGRDLVVPIVNRYANPRQVGQDRLVCAYAAAQLYGCPTVVIDLGTAITFDVVSKKKEYLGGMIIPGIKLSADTLFQRTALLPLVKIRRPRALIGKDTTGSILSGIFYGYGMMIQGMVALIRKQLKLRPKVVVTGGYTDLMKEFIAPQINIVDQDLVLKGMALVWKAQLRDR